MTITAATKLFEEKTAREHSFQYDGVTKGASWRSDVFDYFISKCPDGQPWLEWLNVKAQRLLLPRRLMR